MKRLYMVVFVAFLLALIPKPVSAQAPNILDGWFQCYSWRSDNFDGTDNQWEFDTSAKVYPVDENDIANIVVSAGNGNVSEGEYSNWVCVPFSNGTMYLGLHGLEADFVGTAQVWYTIVAPTDVVGWTMDCAWSQSQNNFTSGIVSSKAGSYVDYSHEFYLNGDAISGTQTGISVLALGVTGADRANWDSVITTFPDPIPSGSTGSIQARFHLWQRMIISTSSEQWHDSDTACSVQSVLQYEGTETVTYTKPPTGWEPVGIIGEPVSMSIFTTTPLYPIAPVTTTFGITSGTESCTVLIPYFTFGPYTVFGYVLEFTIDTYELCITEQTLSLQFLGFDFGAWITILISIGGIGIMYSRFK